MSNPYAGPMQPAPQLAPFSRQISLSAPRALVQVFDAGPRDRPTILLIHGLQDEADTWRHVFGPLAQTHRVIALDLPGFGRSDKARRNYGVPFYADVVGSVLDTLGIYYATLVGNSMGAMIAEHVALVSPGRVARLVLADGTLRIVERPPSAKTSLGRMLFANSYDRRYFEALRKSPQAAFDSLEPYYASLMALPSPERNFLFQRVNERVWDEDQRFASLTIQTGFVRYFVTQVRHLLPHIPRLTIPTQVIWGECDAIVPISNGRARASAQPKATFTLIPGAGHLPHQEQPQAFLSALTLV